MTIDEPDEDYVRFVAERMREKDRAEFEAMTFANTKSELNQILVNRYSNGTAIGVGKDEPIAVGAMVEVRPNVITLMFFATDRFGEIAIDLTRFIKRELFERYKAAGVHRIECVSMATYTASHRWIGILGLEHEATFEGFGRDGQAYKQFAWVKP